MTVLGKIFSDDSKIWAYFAAGIFVSIFLNWMATDILFAMLAVVVLVRSALTSDRKSLVTIFKVFGWGNWLLLAWFLSTVIGYMIAAGLGSEQVEEILGLRWLLSIYLCAFLGMRIRCTPGVARLAFASTAIVLIISAVKQYAEYRRFVIDGNILIRYEGFFGNASVAACTLGLLWAICLGLWAYRRTNYPGNNYEFYALFSITTVCIFLTQSRGTWLALSLVWILFLALQPSRKSKIITAVFFFTAAASYYFNIFYLRTRIDYSLDWSSGNSQSQRFALWRVHWEIFLDNFWFGTGFREPLRLLPVYYERLGIDNRDYSGAIFYSHAHNQLLQTLAGSGFVGCLFFILLFVLAAWYFFDIYKKNSDSLDRAIAMVSVLSLMAFVGNWIFDCPFLIHPARILLLLVIGMSVGYLNRMQSDVTTLGDS